MNNEALDYDAQIYINERKKNKLQLETKKFQAKF